MDLLTNRIIDLTKTENRHSSIQITDIAFEGLDNLVRSKLCWRFITSSPVPQTFFLRCNEYGTVFVSCSSEVIVNLSELSDEKWVIAHMELKGGDPDSDVEVVIKQVGGGWPEEERFLIGTFIRRWPHLRECMSVWFELGLIVQAAMFESAKAEASTLVSV